MPRKTKRVSGRSAVRGKRPAARGKHNPRSKTPKYLRDMEHPTVMGYELDRTTLTPIRHLLPPRVPGQDYGSDPIGDGTFRMVPSGDIVDFEERNRRLKRENPYSSKESERVMYHLGYTRGGQDKANTFGPSLDTDKIREAGNWHIDNQLSSHYSGYERARPILVAAFERGYYDGFSGRAVKMKRVNPGAVDTYRDPKTPYELGFNQGLYDSEAGHRERTATDISFLVRSLGNRFPELRLAAADERQVMTGYAAGWRAASGGDKRALAWEVERTGRMNPEPMPMHKFDLPKRGYLLSTNYWLYPDFDDETGAMKGDARYIGGGHPAVILAQAVGRGLKDRVLVQVTYYGTPYFGWVDKSKQLERGRATNPEGDPEDFKSAGYLPTILKSLDMEGQFYDVMREHHGLSFLLRRHDDGDLTAVVRDMDQAQRGPEVVVPLDQIADVYHYALHHGTLEGWEPNSDGYAPISQADLDQWEEYPETSLENPGNPSRYRLAVAHTGSSFPDYYDYDSVQDLEDQFRKSQGTLTRYVDAYALVGSGHGSTYRHLGHWGYGQPERELRGPYSGRGENPAAAWQAISQQVNQSSLLALEAQYKDLGYETKVQPGPKVKGRPTWQLHVRRVENPAASPEQYRLAQAVLSGTARGHMPKSVAREIVEQTPAGLRSEYSRHNPDYRSEPFAFNAGKTFRTSGAYYETGVAKARVAKYGFNKWLNSQPKSVVKAKTRLMKEFMEGWVAGKRVEAREGNPQDHATELATAYHYGRAAGDARMNRDEARVRFENDSYRKWLHLYTDVKARPQLEAEWHRGYTDTMGERQHNPADGAAAADEMYSTFHGTSPTETVVVDEEIVHHGDVSALGDLEELVVVTPRGHKVVLDFTADPPLLCSSSDGRQLLLRGGDMSIDLAAIKMNGDEWVKDVMVLGDVLSVTYRTAKTMDSGKVLSYEHKFTDPEGAKGGDRAYPVLTYDTLNNRLEFAGGTSINLEAGIVG